MKPGEPPVEADELPAPPAGSMAADMLVWVVSVLATPLVLAKWASTSVIVGWVVIHTVAYWTYVYGRRSHGDTRIWRGGRMASSVVVWGSVPVSAAVAGTYGRDEAFVFLVVIAFMSLRAIVAPDDDRLWWEVDGFVIGAIAGVCSMGFGTPFFGVACLAGSVFFALAERTQVLMHRQASADRQALDEAMLRMTALAFEDPLTGLGNRRAAETEFGGAAADGDVSVLMLDIDDFKVINDRYGHHAGDTVLTEVAAKAQDCLGEPWRLFRLGGDEFIALAEGRHDVDPSCLSDITIEVSSLDGTPVALEVAVSGGSASLRRPITLDEAMKVAEPALRTAKRSAGSHIVPATNDLDAEDRWTFSLRVLDALDGDEFTWWGQPIVDVASGKPVAVELLCRWPRSSGEIVSPGDFLGIVSTFRRQRELGLRTLDEAAAWLDSLRVAGFDDVVINLNAPPSHVAGGLELDLRARLDDRDRRMLGIEVLESEVLDLNATVSQSLEEIRDLGVRVVLDDFGAGYSAFSYLADLPFDVVKLDRALVHNAHEHSRRTAVLQGIAPVFAQLGITTVAEGVETAAEYAIVVGAGVSQAQGWFIAKPQPRDACLDTLERLAGGMLANVANP